MMCWVLLDLLILLTLSCGSGAENEGFVISCAEKQKAFRDSCFEFVGVRLSFFGAQAWCEEGGGHLAFIADEDTQRFLQAHLDPDEDAWFGVAHSKQQSVADEGPLAWLDGSPVSYSKWVSGPRPGAACGHILGNSGFQWEATEDCGKKLPFICQFESGRSIVCADYDTALQCGSGQLIMIDHAFYGRLRPHYCRSIFTAAASTQHECGWVDVVESVAAHCDGRQLCAAAELMSSFGERCPDLRSYLSVDYHCQDSLTLSVNTVAAVLHDVRIGVTLLTHRSEGNLRCELRTGDGRVVYLSSPQGFEQSVVHRYAQPSTFTVAAECITGIIHSTAWKMITIQEPITKIGVIRCFAGSLSFSESSCKALYGAALHIQIEVKAGTNVTYRVQKKEKLLSGLSVVKGSDPQNITVSGEAVKQIGPGCHRLTLYASNMVTFPEVSADLQVSEPTLASISLDSLNETVMNAVAELETQGLLSGETLGELYFTVATQLNTLAGYLGPVLSRQALREDMLAIMIDVVKETAPNTSQEVQVIARGLSALVKKNAELSLTAQKNISDALLDALDNILSASLLFKETNEPPTTIHMEHVSVVAERVSPRKLKKKFMEVSNCSCSAFYIPSLPSATFSSYKSVDLRMMSFDKNPFSWHDGGDVTGPVGALSVSDTDGVTIPVRDLCKAVEIFLPRPADNQTNSSFLDLGNFSTTVINVPSANSTVVLKMIPSEEPLPFKVFLGYLEYPTVTNYVAMVEMPQPGATTEERYTWLLDPVTLKGNVGEHHLVVRPIVGPGIKSINANLSITTITTSCKFWNHSLQTWSDNGCRVGVNSTATVTQCLCNHLTFFGSSFFVTPNLVDPSRSAQLFASFAENPVVVCFVGALFVTFFLVVVWARRKDIQDIAKVKISVLEDNDPMDRYRYLLSIGTGHRIGASTSSQVTVTLLGDAGSSEPHHLSDPRKIVFERGAVDLFLLCTSFSLGDLQGIRLWHNNSGDHPAWFVSTVTVQDLQTKQKWHFLCNSWLSVDMDDCILDKVFPAATDEEMKRFNNLFLMRTTKDFNDGHLWFSVINRPPGSNFTCVQRVSCCFSLLLCTMLTSIMFYGIPTDPSEQTLDLGHFEFTWQQFMVGVQSSLIMFPVNILIVSIFRNTRPRETSCCQRKNKRNSLEENVNSQTASTNTNANITLDIIIKDITRVANSLSNTVKSNILSTESEFGQGQQKDIHAILSAVEDFIKQNTKTCDNIQSKAQPLVSAEGVEKKSNKTLYLYKQLCHIEEELSLMGPSSFPSAQNHGQTLQQVQRTKGLLEDQLFRANCIDIDENSYKKSTDGSHDNKGKTKRRCCHGGLPWWFVFVGWLLVIATSVISGYFTMLYGLKFGKQQSISWLVSTIISFFQSLLFIQPIKVLCLAVFFALVTKNVDEDFQSVPPLPVASDDCAGKDLQPRRRDGSLYKPPPPSDVEKMRRNRIMEQKAFALLWEILTYMGFMWMLLLVAYGQRDPNAFFLNQHIRKSFSENISDSMSLGDVFSWTRTSLLSNLFGVYPGFITDGNSKLVGNARLRQLRVRRSSCQIAGFVQELVSECHSPYSWDMEDMGSYKPGWNRSLTDNTSTNTPDPWTYQTQAQLRSYPIWGQLELYRGGGFVAELGPDSETASSTLEYLFRNSWLDVYTRAILVEFTVYNANVNLFCIVTLLLETAAVGAFQFNTELRTVRLYQSTGGMYIFVMAAEIIYLLFILYYMFLQAKLVKQQRWAYFKNKWNLLDLTIILLSWSAVAVFIARTLLAIRDIAYYHDHKDQFASFYETASADAVLQYLIAFLVLFATVKMWHLLRLHPKMNMISATLQRAWSDISGFLIVLLIMLMAYSFTSYMIYGWKLSSYRTLANAILTIFSLQIGKFDYEEVLNNTSLMGGLLFGSCVVFMTFVVVNLLISVILVAFSEEQIQHKPSEEEEVVDVMLRKIFNIFGIRYKSAADAPRPDANGSSGRNILSSSPEDVNIFHLKPDSKINP
ncbi:polycystic kidney disease protein 1-like 2 [Salarias fasciatus]|uniref:polycystic kidney disease protein 1-like 2 n=1 Tax=Salarias fasciatus TaxID=181472 RepID=UPI0011766243|nr:polycystic kidney disease protein 1-like 2 [Salarias fasciatus]